MWFEYDHIPVPRQRPLLWLSIVFAYAEPPPARAAVSGFEKCQNRPQGGQPANFGHFDWKSVMRFVSKQPKFFVSRSKQYVKYWEFKDQGTKKTVACFTGGKRGKWFCSRHSLQLDCLRYRRFPDARRQATPECSIGDPGVDRPLNSTGTGGASNTAVTRELHGHFGPFARANIQVPPGLWWRSAPSIQHPSGQSGHRDCRSFIALSKKTRFFDSQIGLLKGLPPGLWATALSLTIGWP
jgi:hypothetical protein